MWKGIKRNEQFFELFVSYPLKIEFCGQYIKAKRLSKWKTIYWIVISQIILGIVGLHMFAYVYYTLTTFDALTSLQIQRIFVCTIFGAILCLSCLLNIFMGMRLDECSHFISEGIRIDVDMESKYLNCPNERLS